MMNLQNSEPSIFFRLAAVDMHTAHHIVDHCLQGSLMRGRTVILVTHHISLCLRVASYIVELSHGTVIRGGLIRDLKATGELKTVIDAEDEPFKEDDKSPISQEPGDELLTEISNEVHISSGKLVEAEHRAEGRVSLMTYITYIRAAGWFSWLLTLSLMLLIRAIAIASDVRSRTLHPDYPINPLLLYSFSLLNGLRLSRKE